MTTNVGALFPRKAAPLFRPCHYKVMYGGRGGAKSWAAARAILVLASQRKLFVLCAREIQKSITESIYKLLVDQIDALGLAHAFDVKATTIIGTETGSRIVFAGVRNNITAIKSMEAVDICLLEEAENVTGHSWGVLLPTIRRDPPHGPFGLGSEVWIVFNPNLASDFTYKFWVNDPPAPWVDYKPIPGDLYGDGLAAMTPKPETVLMQMSWRDNPWFPDVLRKQKDDLRRRDYESYLTIWEGQVRRVLQGAIFAKQLEQAQKERRISPNIRVDRSKPVDIGVDLGRGDMTSLWFVQQIGMEHHFIDYYGNFGFDWEHYLKEIQDRKYVIGRIYLPHDARNEFISAKKSVYQQTKDAYPGERRVVVVPRTTRVVNDINVMRTMFSRFYFNEEACADGLHGLSHYRYEVDPETREVKDEPLHDWASHPADGLRSYCMGLKDNSTKKDNRQHVPFPLPTGPEAHGWMGQ